MSLSIWEKELEAILPEVIAFRHELHRHPELSGQEYHTRQAVAKKLTALGMELRFFEDSCSLMGILKNGEGLCIAVRADMDALPMEEKTGLDFASEVDGVMHACGHDAHMALAYGSALWFSRNRDKWQGTIKFLFESQEETIGGGKAMVEQGCMQNPRVDCVIGQHMNPRYPVGTFFCKGGYVSGSSDELFLTVRGKSSHGAYPEGGVDAIVITAQIVSALQTLVARTISPFENAVLTLGTIQGGTANNIICSEVKLTGTLRTLNDKTRTLLQQEMIRTCHGIAAAMGGEAQVEIRPSYGAVYNTPAAYALVEAAAKEIVGEERLVLREAPSLGVESFCYFIQDTPGVYWDIGSGISSALHTSTFRVDEDVFLPGTALQIASVLALLQNAPFSR